MTMGNYSTKEISSQQGSDLKVAIVHDFLLYWGGAEKVLCDIATMFPNAPIYTLLYNRTCMAGIFPPERVRTSFLQKWPRWIRAHHRWLLPFYGTAVETFDLRDYDVIISSSGAWSKGIVTRLNTKHIAYVHSPMRYVWDENEYYLRKMLDKKNGFFARLFLSYLRVWDHQAAQRPDVLVANSFYTQKRIAKYYRRHADVVYPGVESIPDGVEVRDHEQEEKYFLVVSRLSRCKNVALAIETCNKLQLSLVVIGDGSDRKYLENLAGPTVTIVGWVNDEKKWSYISGARAVLFPAEDDFGIVCAEALSAGVPVIALGRGGACEIVENGKTGELFDAPTVEMMADGVRRFLEQEGRYDRVAMIAKANEFSCKNFRKNFQKIIDQYVRCE
jgi:glycosyltransferase involved in cell wall biosynthesis